MPDGPWSPARSGSELDVEQLFAAAEADFARYEVIKDLVDECIDLSLNYRQSGHPGGSRSKVHMMLALLLSGAMRWDLLRPWRRFGDRFVLSAGHTVPLVYATLAVLNEAVRARYERDRDGLLCLPRRRPLGADLGVAAAAAPARRPGRPRRDGRQDALPEVQHRPVRPRDAASRGRGDGPEARRRRRGQGLRDRRRRRPDRRARPTRPRTRPSASASTTSYYLIDWNDCGIDARPASVVVTARRGLVRAVRLPGPGTEHGSEWARVTRAFLETMRGAEPRPAAEHGLVQDASRAAATASTGYKSHGVPHR